MNEVFGTFTVTCTWVSDDPNDPQSDPPPQDVTLDETGYAYYESNDSTLDGGTCDDGLGDPPVPGVNGLAYATSGSFDLNNHHYSVHAGGASFSYQRTATVSPGGDNNSDMDYTVSMSPVTIGGPPVNGQPQPIMSGVTVDTDGSLKLLTGQQVTASLNGCPGNLSDFIWDVSGNAYGAYDTSQPADQLESFEDSKSSVSFYDEEDKDKVTVSCSAFVTFPDGTTGSVSATAPMIFVLKPMVTRWDINQLQGVNYAPSNFGSGGSPEYGAKDLWAPIAISVPAPFGGGSACFAQMWNTANVVDKRSVGKSYVPQAYVKGSGGSYV